MGKVMQWLFGNDKGYESGLLKNATDSENTLADKLMKDRKEDEKNKLEELLKEATLEDEKHKELAKEYKFECEIDNSSAGKLVTISDVTINMNYVANISVVGLGNSPEVRFSYNYGSPDRYHYFFKTGLAEIMCTYGSGKEISFFCNRHIVDDVLIALTAIWKT